MAYGAGSYLRYGSVIVLLPSLEDRESVMLKESISHTHAEPECEEGDHLAHTQTHNAQRSGLEARLISCAVLVHQGLGSSLFGRISLSSPSATQFRLRQLDVGPGSRR